MYESRVQPGTIACVAAGVVVEENKKVMPGQGGVMMPMQTPPMGRLPPMMVPQQPPTQQQPQMQQPQPQQPQQARSPDTTRWCSLAANKRFLTQ